MTPRDQLTMDHLWIALDRAMHRPDSPAWNDLPWQSENGDVRAAWSAITAPENREALELRLSENLNKHTRQVTSQALEECLNRTKASALHEAGHALFGLSFEWPVSECVIQPGRPFTKTLIPNEFSETGGLRSVWEIVDGDVERLGNVDNALLMEALASERAQELYARAILFLVGGDVAERENQDQYLGAVMNKGTQDSDGSKIDRLNAAWLGTRGRAPIGGNIVFRAYEIHGLAVAATKHLAAYLEKKGRVSGIDAITTLLTKDASAYERFRMVLRTHLNIV